MGGTTTVVAPVAPIQDNSAQLMLMEQANDQALRTLEAQQGAESDQWEADMAASENLRMIEIRDAEAQAETEERDRRIAKGKRDLLYMNAMGVDEEDDENEMFKLAGDI